MEDTYYSVEQIAAMLHMHPKTIQRYIREGKLRATKIGKSWRIAGHDLSRFTEEHRTASAPSGNPHTLREQTRASAVVDIAAGSLQAADRITQSLHGAMHSKPPEYGQASLVTQYLEPEGTLRLTLWGNVPFLAAILQMVDAYLQQSETGQNAEKQRSYPMQMIETNGQPVAVISRTEQIRTAQDALDFMATAQYQYSSTALVIYQESLPEEFFNLKTRLAGEILQKFSNYNMKLAIVGDFSRYQSKALRDFITECNRGRLVFWKAELDEALRALAANT